MITVNSKTIAPETISEVGLIRAVLQNLSEETNLTMKAISEKNNEMFPDDKITPQNLNNKLARNRMYFEEIAHIAESLGFDIIFSQREKPKEEPKEIPDDSIEFEEERAEPIKKAERQVRAASDRKRLEYEITVPFTTPEGKSFLIKGKDKEARKAEKEIHEEIDGKQLPVDFDSFLDWIALKWGVQIVRMK